MKTSVAESRKEREEMYSVVYQRPGNANRNKNRGNHVQRGTKGKIDEAGIACRRNNADYHNSEGIKRVSTTIGVEEYSPKEGHPSLNEGRKYRSKGRSDYRDEGLQNNPKDGAGYRKFQDLQPRKE